MLFLHSVNKRIKIANFQIQPFKGTPQYHKKLKNLNEILRMDYSITAKKHNAIDNYRYNCKKKIAIKKKKNIEVDR